MGIWNKAKKAAKKAAKKVAKAAKEVAETVQHTASDIGTAVGNAIEKTGDAIGNAIGANRLGDSVKYLFGAIGSSIKGGFDVIGGVFKTAIVFFIFDFKLFWEGITDVFTTIVGTVLLGAGYTLAFLGTLITIQEANLRNLTKKEREILKRVFKSSLNYDVIRVQTGASGFFRVAGSNPFANGNTIFLRREVSSHEELRPDEFWLLVHEGTHVWQYQNVGNKYAADAIGAQWFVKDEYNWEREINVRNKDDWMDFNAEAQAEFFEDLWLEGELVDDSGLLIERGNGRFYDANWKSELGKFEISHTDPRGTTTIRNYTDLARNAVNTVRVKWSAQEISG